MKPIAILGGGISGLALAYFLKKKYGSKLKLSLFEKSQRVGGLVRTVRKNQYQFEAGPRSLRTQGKGLETLELSKSLGLEDQIIYADNEAKRRYLLRDGQLDPLPQTLLELFSYKSGRIILKALLKEPFQKKTTLSEETVEAFFARRFGKNIAEDFVNPFITGIFGGDAKELSMKACLPKFYELEKKHASLLWGLFLNRNKSKPLNKPPLSPMFSFKEGLATLTDALFKQVKEFCHLSLGAFAIEKKGSSLIVYDSDKKAWEFDKVISTLPLYENRCLLLPYCDSLAKEPFFDSPYSSIVQISMAWKKNLLKKKGFGYLVPEKERQEKILGAIFDSIAFPDQNNFHEETRITFMVGGIRDPKHFFLPPRKLLEMAKKALKNHLGIQENCDQYLIYKAEKAILQTTIGYLDKLESFKKEAAKILPKFILSGTAVSGVSVNDCITHAKFLSEILKAH